MSVTTAYASLGRRIGADLIDSLVVMVLIAVGYAALIVGLLEASGPLMIAGLVLVFLVAFVYPIWLTWHQGATGSTPGKRMLGIRTVDEDTGAPIGFGRSFVRQLVLGLLGPINLVQLFVIPGHPRRQGWHDRAARSVVVPLSAVSRPAATAEPLTPTAPEVMKGPQSPPPLATPQGATNLATGNPPAMQAPVADAVRSAPVGMVPPPPGITVPPADPAPVPVAAPPIERTMVGTPPPVTAPAMVAAGPISPPPGVPSALAWVLTTATGQQRPVTGPVLVGRDPDGGLVDDAAAWAIDDPDLTVSKTHALFGVDDDGKPWVEDWHSTNGVELDRGGKRTELTTHDRTELRAGDVVRLGDFAISVEVDV